MGLRIFDTGTESAPKKSSFADDLVGRFRSGYQANNRPVALSEWRVTTGDPKVAEKVQALLGGDEVGEWEASGEDNLEVMTTSKSVDVIIDGPGAIRQQMVLWGRNGIIRSGDGETLDDGTPDPQAGQSLSERKAAHRAGTGSGPDISITFRLADDPDLGVFQFRSGSWSLASDLSYFGVVEALEAIGGPARVTLSLEHVEYTAKNGPRAGQLVSYTKPFVKVHGAAK